MSAHADIAVFHRGRDQVGESPLWDPIGGCLFWVDVLERRIYRAAFESGETDAYEVPEPPGALALVDDGTLIVAAGLAWQSFDPASRTFDLLAHCGTQSSQMRLNDGVVDTKGRFWTGTLHEARDPVGELFCLTQTCVRSAVGGLRTQNGCAISPDGCTFYLADTHPDVRTIWAFDFDGDAGTLQNRRVFHRPRRGRPDGAAVDADGCYWYAAVDAGLLVQVDPDGREMRAIALPVSRPTKPAFGGPDLSVIYVTSMSVGTDPVAEPLAGAVFAIDAGVRGCPVPRFARVPAPPPSSAGGFVKE
jgi:sugar lactone lactonase YvrE